MHVALFKALKSIKVADNTATEVVDKLDSHIAMKISEANKALEAKLDLANQRLGVLIWIVTTVGLLNLTAPLWSKFLS